MLSAGNVVQVVYTNCSVKHTVSSTSYVDVDLQGIITPQFANSKIIVMINYTIDTNADDVTGARVLRNGTQIKEEGYWGYMSADTSDWLVTRQPWWLEDSPNTTSAVTYKLQAKRISGDNSFYPQYSDGTAGTDSQVILMEIRQ